MSLKKNLDHISILPGSIAVFTDLDATLLDHDTYDWHAALPAIKQLRELEIPLIAVSSKTLAELEALNAQNGLFDGLIGENGGVLSFGGEIDYTGPSAKEIDAAREEIARNVSVPVNSFRIASADEIALKTGLPKEDAERAGLRNCSDPLIWDASNEDIETAQKIAGTFGLRLVKGGRFHTLCGTSTKGDAMKMMIARLISANRLETDGTTIRTIALGDSANDIPMLEAADFAVQIPHKGDLNPSPLIDKPDNFFIANQPGPAGWNSAIISILNQTLNSNKNER